MVKGLYQTSIILLLAIVTALVFNFIRDVPLPLSISWIKGEGISQGKIQYISADRALAYLLSNEAIFVDARSPAQYKNGHIKGALNIPFQRLDEYYEVIDERIPSNKMIITYCEGGECELSTMLARELLQMGYSNIWVLDGGWSQWVKQGLPETRP